MFNAVPATCFEPVDAASASWPAAPTPNATNPASARDEAALTDLLRHPGIWRRRSAPAATIATQPSGHAALDALLPGGGWPQGALCELLVEHDGLGECSLLLPTLAALTQARRRVVLVAPPWIAYAPALAAAGIDLRQLVQLDASSNNTHWSIEQCLRSGCCGAVLGWLPRTDYRELRRLQLAAETGGTLGFMFRPLAAADSASPSTLRLRIGTVQGEPQLELLKCRGRVGGMVGMRLRA
ncbi:MAG: translesion DNA synthesis-associated protein ImuA [Dokdonella sp.]|uniref:translesion DNA synthesis-associated protein ImuA n=1 Tax=Dokdonella sp. TaxID=2291710 RepID=UPI0025BE4843|nr:translesion DNA synthesis-associated protein ImuA [Dokdonella sp.]MBZ0222117.1 translesion DNA synthesis-associated protein ImuA [Dokdonella sp.]MCC7254756.1 translesion DNA synthesis-associated protein ImuA [Dokdonella sp.]